MGHEMKQQGDVLINPILTLPEGTSPVQKKSRGWVLAEGETTGHAHVVEGNVEMYEKDGTLYLHVMEESTITHEEHSPITVDPGLYEIGIVVEIDPFTEQVRKVVD